MQHDLNWNNHVKNICASVMQKLGLIKCKLKHSLSHLELLTYDALNEPKLEYCSIVWDTFTKEDIARTERVKRLAE